MTATRPVALVTGASSGIGKAAALALVGAGLRWSEPAATPHDCSPRQGVTYLDLDVTSDESVSSVVEQVIDRFGRIDVLVNNAGLGNAGAAEESSVAQDQRVFDVNVFGIMRMTKAVLPHMRAQGADASSTSPLSAGSSPQPFMAAYVATKHAVEGYSESLDHEVREHGVRVLLVEPFNTNTPFDANVVRADSPLPIYAQQRRIFDDVLAEAMRDGDDPAVVAKMIVAAGTDRKPKLRYPAGPRAGRISVLRRIVPARTFDKSVRKLNRLAA